VFSTLSCPLLYGRQNRKGGELKKKIKFTLAQSYRIVLSYHLGSVKKALLHLYPDIGLDMNKLLFLPSMSERRGRGRGGKKEEEIDIEFYVIFNVLFLKRDNGHSKTGGQLLTRFQHEKVSIRSCPPIGIMLQGI
jgi:hypothetical protein